MYNKLISRTFLVFASAFLLATASADCISDGLTKYANGDHRAEGNAARNESRKPVEVLKFFGLTPSMTVVEISPGGSGWYTEILAPFLRDSGTLYLGSFDPAADSDYVKRNYKALSEKLAAHPEVYNQAQVRIFDPAGTMDAAPEGSADMVLTFRNTHGWARRGQAEGAFAHMYKYLKPGGILGLVQHRGDESETYTGETGYLNQSDVIAMAEKAGFVLLDKSEMLANPRDTKNHPSGVWSLPPGLNLDDDSKHLESKMKAIGESDRMTLKFMRPVERSKT
ncbi:MAG: class I SAM-dependent methyltransferase [Gammaproteobacteria bacterium]